MAETVWVNRSDLSDVTINNAAMPELEQGAVRISIESFAVTANNITYAVAGESMGYWNFFPAPDGFGIVPMWGHGVIEQSNNPHLNVGERVYGYMPMGSHLDVMPAKIRAGYFFDDAPHRQAMSPIYNQYSRIADDPEHDPLYENQRMVFAPLFKTGFLIDDFFRRNDWYGAQNLIMTSASSKTALGLASCANNLSPGIKRIGLTSPGNMAFTIDTGLYHEVISYDDMAMLPHEPSVLVDFAGNSPVLHTVHEALKDNLKYSCLVGATHINERSGGIRGICGPKPVLFFAPSHAVEAIKADGADAFGAAVAAQWKQFLHAVDGCVEITEQSGISAAAKAYTAILKNEASPSIGVVIHP